MTIKAKLLASFGLLAAIVVALSGFAIFALDGANERFTGFVDGVNARVMLVNRIRSAVDRRAIAARNLVLATTDEERVFEKAEAERAHEEVQAGLAELEARLAAPGVTDRARQLGGDIRRIENAYGPVALGIVKLAADGQREAANQKINAECKPLLDALVKAVKVYASVGAELSKRTLQEAQARAEWLRSIVIGVSLASVALAVGLGLVITRSLLRALGTEPARGAQRDHPEDRVGGSRADSPCSSRADGERAGVDGRHAAEPGGDRRGGAWRGQRHLGRLSADCGR
ncbi:MCP four helix bundle domain-containing protein [Ralstonia solanacearum]|nr:MCP four helix bundle domain-containing protein [Ralstonia solanacearum]MDB0578451.1 MCP four helix bundle domain-containing protein [Ralstonia solanacearum]